MSSLSMENRLEQMLRNGDISFLYHSEMIDSPEVLFKRLREYQASIVKSYGPLRGYKPKYGLFQTKSRLNIESKMRQYWDIDVLSDYFNEQDRVRAKRINEPLSPLDFWTTNSRNLVEKIMKHESLASTLLNREPLNIVDKRLLRSCLYQCVKGTSQFKLTWLVGILAVLYPRRPKELKWLDISAGYGDRLIMACLYGWSYHGFDPNQNLQSGYSKIINKFGDSDKHKIEALPFEDAKLEGEYDLVLSSPPFFNLEEYNSDPNQSSIRYPEINQWLIKFLFTSLRKAWEHLTLNGYLVIHMADSDFNNICEAMNLFIEQYLPLSSWVQPISITGAHRWERPIWIWKKVESIKEVKHWSSPSGTTVIPVRNFSKLYPHLGLRLIYDDCSKILSKDLELPKINSKIDLNQIIEDYFNISSLEDYIEFLLKDIRDWLLKQISESEWTQLISKLKHKPYFQLL